MEALTKAIGLAGGQKKLATVLSEHLPGGEGIGSTAIANWLQRGQVPADKVISVSRAVGFQVTPHELRPDLYPLPDDGLPLEIRERVA